VVAAWNARARRWSSGRLRPVVERRARGGNPQPNHRRAGGLHTRCNAGGRAERDRTQRQAGVISHREGTGGRPGQPGEGRMHASHCRRRRTPRRGAGPPAPTGAKAAAHACGLRGRPGPRPLVRMGSVGFGSGPWWDTGILGAASSSSCLCCCRRTTSDARRRCGAGGVGLMMGAYHCLSGSGPRPPAPIHRSKLPRRVPHSPTAAAARRRARTFSSQGVR